MEDEVVEAQPRERAAGRRQAAKVKLFFKLNKSECLLKLSYNFTESKLFIQ